MMKYGQQTNRLEKISDFFGNKNFSKQNLYAFLIPLWAFLLYCSINMEAADSPVRVGSQGDFRFEELSFSLAVIYSPGWNVARILPCEVKAEENSLRSTNAVTIARTPDGILDWEIGSISNHGFRYRVQFAIPDLKEISHRYIDMQISDQEALKLEWQTVGGKSESLVFGKNVWKETDEVKLVTLTLKNGVVYFFDVQNVSLWIQDNRIWNPKAGFSVRFEALRQETIALTVRRQSPAVHPVDISTVTNRTFADPVANDGKGGWTDQGPGNDLSMFKEKYVKYQNVLFRIIDEAKTGTPGSIVVAGHQRNMAPREIQLPLPTGLKVSGLSLLHASGWISTNLIGEIVVRYADTGTQTIPINGGNDVGNWWVGGDFRNAKVAWASHNNVRTIGLYASSFVLSGSEPVSLTFRIVHPEAIWMIAGVTLTERPMLLPSYVPQPVTAIPGKEWKPIKYERRVTPGSPLDFTEVVIDHKPAGKFGFAAIGKDGTITFEKAPGRRLRLNGVNLCETALLLSNREAEELAVFLAAQGINAVRFHHHDNLLVDPNTPDSVTLNAKNLDRMEYLIAKLKEHGIYITFDVYTSRKLKLGDNLEVLKRYPDYLKTGHTGAKNAFLFNDDAFENWKTFARRWLTHVNPYTGLSLTQDPVVAFVNLSNEDTIGNAWNHTPGSTLYRFLSDEFAVYCAKHSGLNPSPLLGNKDYVEFLYATAKRRSQQMMDFLHNDLKASFLMTSANNGGDQASTWLRDTYDIVDDHIYQSHPMFPEKAWNLPMEFSQSSVISGHAWVPLNLMGGRIYGKPFFITEFNFCAPNIFRAEDGPLMGAYCALNDIDGIFRFNFSSSKERLNGQVKKMIVFESCYDPVAQTSDRITGALFVRGDVTPSPVKASYTIPRNLFAEIRDYGFPAMEASGLITQIGAMFDDRIVPGVSDHRHIADARARANFMRYREDKVAESVTGEIILAPEKKTLQISTPKSAVVTLPEGDSTTGGILQVGKSNTFQTFAAISLDKAGLAKSDSIIVLQSTDMVTTGTRFADRDYRRVEAVGEGPLLMKRGTARLALAVDAPRQVTAVDFQGDFLGEILCAWKDGVLTFDADNCYFEQGVAGYHITRKTKKTSNLALPASSCVRFPDDFLESGSLPENAPIMTFAEENSMTLANRWRGKQDLSARVAIGWNRDGLCFRFDVTDSEVINEKPHDVDLWMQDSVEIFIAAPEGKRLGNQEFSFERFQLILSPPDMNGKIRNFMLYDSAYGPSIPFKAKGKLTASGYQLYIGIPWSSLGNYDLRQEQLFRLQFNCNDYDRSDGNALPQRKISINRVVQPSASPVDYLTFRLCENMKSNPRPALDLAWNPVVPRLIDSDAMTIVLNLPDFLDRAELSMRDSTGQELLRRKIEPTEKMLCISGIEKFNTIGLQFVFSGYANGKLCGEIVRNSAQISGLLQRIGKVDWTSLTPWQSAWYLALISGIEFLRLSATPGTLNNNRMENAIQECECRLALIDGKPLPPDAPSQYRYLELARGFQAQLNVSYSRGGRPNERNFTVISLPWGNIPCINAEIYSFNTVDDAEEQLRKWTAYLSTLPAPAIVGADTVRAGKGHLEGDGLRADFESNHLLSLYSPDRPREVLRLVPEDAFIIPVDAIVIMPDAPELMQNRLREFARIHSLPEISFHDMVRYHRTLIAGTPPYPQIAYFYHTHIGLVNDFLMVRRGNEVIRCGYDNRILGKEFIEFILAGKPIMLATAKRFASLRSITMPTPRPEDFTVAKELRTGDTHTHTIFSDGQSTPAGLLANAPLAGLDWLVISDHDEVEGALRLAENLRQHHCRLALLVGTEVTMSPRYHINVYPLKDRIGERFSWGQIFEAAKKCGAVTQLNHPMTYGTAFSQLWYGDFSRAGFDAVERRVEYWNKWHQAAVSKVPTVTGSTDTHIGIFGYRNCTVVRTPEFSGLALAGAIRAGQSAMLDPFMPALTYGNQSICRAVAAALLDPDTPHRFGRRLTESLAGFDAVGLIRKSETAPAPYVGAPPRPKKSFEQEATETLELGVKRTK